MWGPPSLASLTVVEWRPPQPEAAGDRPPSPPTLSSHITSDTSHEVTINNTEHQIILVTRPTTGLVWSWSVRVPVFRLLYALFLDLCPFLYNYMYLQLCLLVYNVISWKYYSSSPYLNSSTFLITEPEFVQQTAYSCSWLRFLRILSLFTFLCFTKTLIFHEINLDHVHQDVIVQDLILILDPESSLFINESYAV